MKKQIFRVLSVVIFAGAAWIAAPNVARADIPRAVGDRVLVVAPVLQVHSQSAVQSNLLDELLPGTVSHVLKTQAAADTTWLYLADNAYAWVPLVADGKQIGRASCR